MDYHNINIYTNYNNLRYTYSLGEEQMVQSFFSNIAYHLENKDWGSKYPIIMNIFYGGKLEAKYIKKAIKEIRNIQTRLKMISCNDIIWDIGDLNKKPPTGILNNLTLDEFFINENQITLTELIIMVLKSALIYKATVYVGNYYFDETIIQTGKKHREINYILLNLIAYAIIILIVKLSVDPKEYSEFIYKFSFSILIAIIFYIHTYLTVKKKLKDKLNESEYNRTLTNKMQRQNREPNILKERITFRKDLRSSFFDNVLDKIECKKTFNGIKEKLKLNKINDWENDLKSIFTKFNYNEEYYEYIHDDFKSFNIESYELKIDNQLLELYCQKGIYNSEGIYRIIKANDNIYLYIFSLIE